MWLVAVVVSVAVVCSLTARVVVFAVGAGVLVVVVVVVDLVCEAAGEAITTVAREAINNFIRSSCSQGRVTAAAEQP